MQNKPILKILAISIVLLIFVSSAAPSIAVDDSTNNKSYRLDELPFYDAAIQVQHSQQSDHEIHIGYQPSTHQIAAMLAAEKGWWEEDLRKFGIENVIMKKFPSGPPEMSAMLAGDLDVAYVGVAPPIAAMYEGLDAKIVVGVQTQGSALVIRPELADEYEGPISLKGKTIATFPPGSIQHTVLSKWLLDNGIDPEGEVNLKAMGPSEATTAIGANAVDAVFLPSPYPTIIELAGNGVIVEWSGSIWPNHACCCVVASGEMIRKHPEMLKQIIKTHIRATEYKIAHPNEAAEIYAQRHGVDVSTIKRSINVSDMQWIHDPHLEVESGIKLAAVIYDLNRERYEGRGVEVFEEEDIFDTSFYDDIRSVIPDVNAQSSIEWHTSDQDAMQIAMSQNKPAMILFSSDRCPACAMLADELVDTRVINMSKNFVPVIGSRGLDSQYGIRYIPTIVFTNSQGEEVYRTVGYRDADTLVQEMQKALSLSTTLDVPFFSQRDPAWCDKKLDHSAYSIGEYGCALTLAAMVSKYVGYDTDPYRLNTSLTAVGGLDASGILHWKKVEEVSGGKVEWIGWAEGNWSRLDQELSNKNPVIANVTCSLGNHFIVFIGKVGTDYYFLDPYDESLIVNKWPNGAHGEYTLNNLRIYHGGLQIGDIVKTTVYLHVRNITDWNNPLDPDNRIFTMHPPDERTNPPYDVGKIVDGPKTDNQSGYTWWKIEWDNGEVGWSVEGPFDKPAEKWLKKTDKTFIKIQDLEDLFSYQGEYELNQTELRAEEKKEEVLQNVTRYAKKYKISPALIMAIIRQESDFNANVKGDYWNGEYHSFGYMQVSYGAANDTYNEYTGDEYKGTEEEWKNDGLDPETNIKYGVRYLRILHDRIKDGCSGYEDVYGDILKSTISAYNAGHPTLTNRMCYVLGGRCNGQYAGVIEGKSVNGEHRGYKFFLSNRIPTAKPVITTPLETTAKNIYYVGDTLTAKFTITNRAAKSVTFDVLVVGGRDPTGEVVDFDKTYAVTLNPGDSYDYEGYLILPDKPGIYHFFCAYHTEEHMPGEDEYNWNTNIDVEIEGKIVEDFSEAKKYRERDIIVFEETYISPAPPPVLWEEIDGPWDSWPTSLGNWNEAPQIDVNPNNPNEIYLEAIHRTNNWWEDQGGKLYKSTDGGDSWNPINPGLPGLTLSEYYWPIRAIAIAPSNPDIIYVGTSDLNPYFSLLPSAKGIYKSTNGGSEWTSVGGPYTGKWIFKTFCSISSMVVNPTDSDTAYAGTVGGGIWMTTNGGESWERIWDEPVNKETLLDVNALAISPANPNTIYAAAYNFDPVNAMGWSGILIPNRFIKSEDGGDTWERLRLGILTAAPKIDDIAVDYKDADIVYVIIEHYKVYNSTDGGKNWDDASGTGGSNPLPYVFRPWSLGKSGSMSIHPDYSNVIYAAGEWGFKYVYFSSDSGENWFPFRDLKDKHVKEIVLASNADSHVIYAAAIEGLFKVDISEPEENEMMIKVVEEGDYVRVDYIGKLEDATVFDTSMKDVAIDAGIYNHKRDYQPLGFTVGAGEMINGFDKGVVGMVVGEDKTLTIRPEEAYGNYREDLVQAVARDQFPTDSELEVGQMLQASQPDGQIILVTITNVTDSDVTLDANHRLAGKTLIFDVTLVSIGGE